MQASLKLGFFIQPVHPPLRAYAEVLREDRDAVVLADRLGYREAFIGEHLVDAAETITSSLAFIASLAGKPVYEGQFVSPATSRGSDKVSIVVDIDPRTPNEVSIQRGYAIDETKLFGKDPRSDERVRNSLEAAGKLR